MGLGLKELRDSTCKLRLTKLHWKGFNYSSKFCSSAAEGPIVQCIRHLFDSLTKDIIIFSVMHIAKEKPQTLFIEWEILPTRNKQSPCYQRKMELLAEKGLLRNISLSIGLLGILEK